MFLCRESELAKLNKRYYDDRFECVIIYGRRRVGKTSLINEFSQGKKTIYFSALKATAQENLRTLSRAIALCMDPDATAVPEYRSFDDAFSAITQIAEQERVILVIDEYPYLAGADNSISSRLQHLIDHTWSKGKLFLILCGSSMSFMEHQVLGYESPLYGRRTAQFKIEPLTYRETAMFHPELTPEENALIYGITGGIPHYINKLDVRGSLDDALLENFFDRSSYLFEEPENLLKQELREPAVYNSIITAIAEGASRLNEIATKVGLETGACSKYLTVLMELGIVRRETPITEKTGKRSVYQIADHFFRFWYRFVPQNISAIQSGRISRTYYKAIQPFFSDYMGLVFEQICREWLLYYAEDLPIDLNEVGQWWGTDSRTHQQVQIDIVGTPARGDEYMIGSCKYRNSKVDSDELELMESYAKAFGKGSNYYYYLFSKGGFQEKLLQEADSRRVKLITLDMLYGA